MKPFLFKLQTALDIKLKEEDIQKEKLYQATKVYKQNLRMLTGLKNRLVEIQDILRGKQVKNIDVLEIKNCQDYIPVLNERIKQQEEKTEDSRLEMERVRSKLLEIMKKRKILEKLKTRHYQEYMREFLREEQKQIDEMATIGYVHKDSAV
ncbi:MAG: flagellar export protein FliJ [Firmicutes bacterium HGW-Firmicutes-8]|nr:MAG: flagellar export protein FliJ [Firmicutes bacterium HGW-Firmicutes-8]